MTTADWDVPSEFLYYIPERLYSLLLLSNHNDLFQAKSTVDGVKQYARTKNLCELISYTALKKAVLEKLSLRDVNELTEALIALGKDELCDILFLINSKSLNIFHTENNCKFISINNCEISYNVRKLVLPYDKLIVISDSPLVELLQLSGTTSTRLELDEKSLLDGRDVVKGENFALIGLSNDTNVQGSQALANALSLEFIALVLSPRGRLRTYLKLISKDLAIANVRELKRSSTITLRVSGRTESMVMSSRTNLHDELRSLKFEIVDVHDVDLRSVIKVSERTLLVGANGNRELLKALNDMGYDVILSHNTISEDYVLPVLDWR